jgi:hypothetical protein
MTDITAITVSVMALIRSPVVIHHSTMVLARVPVYRGTAVKVIDSRSRFGLLSA